MLNILTHSPVAQSVERVAVNHHVRGSSPRWGAINNMADFLNEIGHLHLRHPLMFFTPRAIPLQIGMLSVRVRYGLYDIFNKCYTCEKIYIIDKQYLKISILSDIQTPFYFYSFESYGGFLWKGKYGGMLAAPFAA
jgi:hypothetical protein